jgi:hypothetical protein
LLSRTYIRSNSIFRFIKCMLLNVKCSVNFLINRKDRGKIVKLLAKINMILSMHHIALCTPCIALVNYGHLLHIRVDHG